MSRGFVVVALWNPKYPHNIGGVLRAAGCYGAKLVVIGGPRRTLTQLPADTQRLWRHTPVQQVADLFDALPVATVPIAVDILPDARSLPSFCHPERAFYIFGPEDGTLDETVTSRCQYRVMIPSLCCLNLAAAVNVVLYDRQAKRG